MNQQKKNNVVRINPPFQLNVGIVVFAIIFIYLLFHVVQYMLKDTLAIYEVQYGTIVENNTYQALCVREETIVTCDYSGSINYYLKDTSKASVKTLVYSIDEDGAVASLINEAVQNTVELDSDDLSEMEDTISEFLNVYTPERFFTIYNFKETMESEVMEAVNLAALESIRASTTLTADATFHEATATEPGIVLYYIDGYEDVTVDNFTDYSLSELDYSKTNLKAISSVTAGDPVYKLVTNEDWNLIIEVDSDTYQDLMDSSTIQIRFTEDNATCYASYTFEESDGHIYMILSLTNSVVRYANSRFTEIELLVDEETGLKIPNSSITEKEFFVVPKEYFYQGGDSSDYGLMVQVEEGGSRTYEFLATDLYYETDDAYYIDEEEISTGTVIRSSDSSSTYTIQETATLKGVYNVNKGYAIFKQIEILYQNAEYSIVETGTSYGLSLYDHIALDGSKITEGEIVN